ncbi:MAG: DUF370 domain-containing protein [Clostridia bacterium]|nr:DUF370 domain-containing protein [Clostridia bacterium]
MFIHLGQTTTVKKSDIVGIFDLDTSTVSVHTRNFLKKAEQNNQVINVSTELPKSFVITSNGKKNQTVYISQLAASTLEKRSENFLKE